MHNFIVRISTIYVWLTFFVGFLVFNLYVMKNAGEHLNESCGNEVKIPDLQVGYSAEQLKNMLNFMSESCRETYIQIATITDSFYPVIYGLFFFFSIAIIYYKTNVPQPKNRLYVFPLFAILADFGENLSIVKLLRSEHMSDAWLNAASIFSLFKWFFIIFSFVLILLGLIRWAMIRFKKPA